MNNIYNIAIATRNDVIRNQKSASNHPTKISQLISSTLEGNINAFGVLVNRYQLRIVNLAFRLTGNMEDAKDIAQEVFIKVYHSLSRFNNEGEFYTWLYNAHTQERFIVALRAW